VALVGASGCGKSTSVALIERFYEPRRGQILVDGISVSDYHLADYRKCISLVSQEPTYTPIASSAESSLYQGTIRFNILLGSNEENPTDEALDQSCKAANVRIRPSTLLTSDL
jgi:ATP-binding cassette subfamily B (MDR/TAP) protein 1